MQQRGQAVDGDQLWLPHLYCGKPRGGRLDRRADHARGRARRGRGGCVHKEAEQRGDEQGSSEHVLSEQDIDWIRGYLR